MIRKCDNIASCHDPVVIKEDDNGCRIICKTCKHQEVIRKDYRGIPENRQYSKVFKRDVIQGHENLFYKIHPEYLRQ